MWHNKRFINLRHQRWTEATVFTPVCLLDAEIISASLLLGSVKSFSVCLSLFVTCEKKFFR